MRVALMTSLATAILLSGCAQKSQQAVPQTDEDKALYSLGVLMSDRMGIKNFEFTEQELAMVKAGVADGALDKSILKPEELDSFMPKLNELHETRVKASAERAKTAGAEYLTKAAAEAGAEKTASGMIYQSVKEGTGASPVAEDTVKVHYEGRLLSGKVFDSSRERGEPATFPLGGVIPCWTEGVQKMKVGGTAKLVCPPDLAYGEQGNPSIPGNSTLTFDVELLEIVKPDAAAAAQ
jgi:FKBP-type peptidyl-prolyl cis-trans isomerase FkpA